MTSTISTGGAPRPISDGSHARVKAHRRAELLAASLLVIRRDGAAASMDAMAAEAGITKPILYRHFGDREGLIAAVANLFADDLVQRLSTALQATRSASPRNQIEAAVDSYVSFIEADPALYGFLARETPAGGPVLLGVADRVAEVLRAAMDEGFAAAGLSGRPTRTWSYAMVGMVHLAGAHWAAEADAPPRTQLVQELTALIADGLVPPDLPAEDS